MAHATLIVLAGVRFRQRLCVYMHSTQPACSQKRTRRNQGIKQSPELKPDGTHPAHDVSPKTHALLCPPARTLALLVLGRSCPSFHIVMGDDWRPPPSLSCFQRGAIYPLFFKEATPRFLFPRNKHAQVGDYLLPHRHLAPTTTTSQQGRKPPGAWEAREGFTAATSVGVVVVPSLLRLRTKMRNRRSRFRRRRRI